MSTNRRYDIDWLRVIAIGLLLIYHIAIAFQPWGVFIGFIQNNESLESIWIPMSALNVWRIPFLFMVSGMGVAFALERRNWKQLISERSRRILVPFLFGLLCIVPIHVFFWQHYYHQEFSHPFNPAHLWFLGNIYVYVLLLSPIFFYLKKNKEGKIHRVMKSFFSNPISLIMITIPFILESELMNPESFEYYAMNMHGFVLGLIAFFTGYCLVFSGDGFWKHVTKGKWILLVGALGLYLTRLLFFELKSPYFLMSMESCMWIYAVMGFGHHYLNRPSAILSYLSQAAYPIYIIHMVFIYVGSSYLFELNLNPWIKLIGINLITFVGCFATYEIIRRVVILRPLFGLKLQKKHTRTTPVLQPTEAGS